MGKKTKEIQKLNFIIRKKLKDDFEKVIKPTKSKSEKIKFIKEMKRINKNAAELQKAETERIKKLRSIREKYDI